LTDKGRRPRRRSEVKKRGVLDRALKRTRRAGPRKKKGGLLGVGDWEKGKREKKKRSPRQGGEPLLSSGLKGMRIGRAVGRKRDCDEGGGKKK